MLTKGQRQDRATGIVLGAGMGVLFMLAAAVADTFSKVGLAAWLSGLGTGIVLCLSARLGNDQ